SNLERPRGAPPSPSGRRGTHSERKPPHLRRPPASAGARPAHTAAGRRRSFLPPRWWAGGCPTEDRKSTRLNSSHVSISYAVFCLKKKNNEIVHTRGEREDT